MSLMAFTGKQRNLLDETPEHCRQLKLTHPILTNEDIERLRTANAADFKVVTLPALFARPMPTIRPRALRRAPGRPGRRGRSGDSRGGVALDPQRPRRIAQPRRPSPACWPPSALHHGLLRAAAAERGRHRRRKRRAARSHALLPALRLRGERHQSLPGLRGHPQAARRRRPAAKTCPSSS